MATQNTPTHFFRIPELSKRWDVSEAYVRRAVWRGQLHAARFGRALRIPRGEVERIRPPEHTTPEQAHLYSAQRHLGSKPGFS